MEFRKKLMIMMSLILLVLTTSTTCEDIDYTLMQINNNTGNVIFIYPADEFRTYPPTTLPTENNFYGHAKVIEPYDNKSIAIDYFYDLVTVIVIEHDLDMIANSDYVIDMGPGGGETGGEIVAIGTPEEIATNIDSLTGKYLKKEIF